jgi:hypothetical protein
MIVFQQRSLGQSVYQSEAWLVNAREEKKYNF